MTRVYTAAQYLALPPPLPPVRYNAQPVVRVTPTPGGARIETAARSYAAHAGALLVEQTPAPAPEAQP